LPAKAEATAGLCENHTPIRKPYKSSRSGIFSTRNSHIACVFDLCLKGELLMNRSYYAGSADNFEFRRRLAMSAELGVPYGLLQLPFNDGWNYTCRNSACNLVIEPVRVRMMLTDQGEKEVITCECGTLMRPA